MSLFLNRQPSTKNLSKSPSRNALALAAPDTSNPQKLGNDLDYKILKKNLRVEADRARSALKTSFSMERLERELSPSRPVSKLQTNPQKDV